jgi:hypothetical protein
MWWGLQPPEGVETAWGARAIDDGKSFGLLPDRQSMKGPGDRREALTAKLNGGVLKACQIEFARLKNCAEIDRGERKEVVLYAQGGVKVVGNTNASHGYFYVCAYTTNKEERNET